MSLTEIHKKILKADERVMLLSKELSTARSQLHKLEEEYISKKCKYSLGDKFVSKDGKVFKITEIYYKDYAQADVFISLRAKHESNAYRESDFYDALKSKTLIPLSKEVATLADVTHFNKAVLHKVDGESKVYICSTKRGKCVVFKTRHSRVTQSELENLKGAVLMLRGYQSTRFTRLKIILTDRSWAMLYGDVLGVYKDYKELATQYLM